MLHTKLALRRRWLRAFSLVELLMVIAIISVLVALVLPSLRQARESALTARCASNLKQNLLAMHAYAVDYNNKTPSFYPDATGLQAVSMQWAMLINPYVNGPDPSTMTAAINQANAAHKRFALYRCPHLHGQTNNTNFGVTYGVNIYAFVIDSYLTNVSTGAHYKSPVWFSRDIPGSIRPSQLYVISDSTYAFQYTDLRGLKTPSVYLSVFNFNVHNTAANIGFGDGHVTGSRPLSGTGFYLTNHSVLGPTYVTF